MKNVKTRSLFHSEEDIERMIRRYGAMFAIRPDSAAVNRELTSDAPVKAGHGFSAVEPACC